MVLWIVMCSFGSIIIEVTTAAKMIRFSSPYFVVLRSKYSKGSHRICGGVIVKSTLIITAAECFHHNTNTPEEIEVRDETGNSRIKIAQIVAHPDYNSSTSCNNIALLHTTSDIKFSDSVYPAKLPPRNYYLREDAKSLFFPEWGQRPVSLRLFPIC